MGSRPKKKVKALPQQQLGDEDRLSRLPDKLIHQILSFVDAKQAVQTSILSRRWQLIWTTLPFLSFGQCLIPQPQNVGNFIHHVLSDRNHESHVSDLKLRVYGKVYPEDLFEEFVAYAILHDVQSLNLELPFYYKPFKLSAFSSMSLKKLRLKVTLCELQSDFWDLPALTTLHLKYMTSYDPHISDSFLKDSLFTCLPALTTLCLDGWDLSQSSTFSFPGLTTLRLSDCMLPEIVWDLPDLLSLRLDGLYVSDNVSDILSALVNLKNLTLFLPPDQRVCFISCPPHLLNLSITITPDFCHSHHFNLVVSAPKLCNFNICGIFAVTTGVPELENVNISLQGSMKFTFRKQYHWRLTNMLPGLSNAKNLTFDLESIEALNEISDVLVSLPSPFGKLKYVKLPRGFKESSISSAVRTYLLGGSPNAMFVTKLPQNNGVEDSMIEANRVRHTDSSVEETIKDQASSSRGERDSGLWRSHEVNSEFVGLLDRIMHKYPETFEHFTIKNKKLCTMNLNMLCNSLNDFFKISVANVEPEMMGEYREVFSYLQNQGFNLSWVVDRLNYVEHLRFSKPLISELHSIDCHIDNAKTKLQDLQALRVEKLSEIEKAFGTRGTNLAAGFIGDDLLASP